MDDDKQSDSSGAVAVAIDPSAVAVAVADHDVPPPPPQQTTATGVVAAPAEAPAVGGAGPSAADAAAIDAVAAATVAVDIDVVAANKYASDPTGARSGGAAGGTGLSSTKTSGASSGRPKKQATATSTNASSRSGGGAGPRDGSSGGGLNSPSRTSEREREREPPLRPASSNACWNALDRVFGAGRGSRLYVKREVLGGITMWLCTLYILTAQPLYQSGVLLDTGDGRVVARVGLADKVQALTTSTALVTGLATISVALICNTPLVISTGMGLNASFVTDSVLTAGESWQSALGLGFVSGVGYLLIVITIQAGTGGSTAWLFSLPQSFRIAIGVGIGLFLAFLGLLQQSGIGFADLSSGVLELPRTFRYEFFVAVGGLLLFTLFLHYKWTSAYVLGILAVTAADVIIRAAKGDTLIASDAFGHYDMGSVVGRLSFDFQGDRPAASAAVAIVGITLKLFDVMGTVLTLAAAIVIDAAPKAFDEHLFRRVMKQSVPLRRIFLVDAVWLVLAPVFGLSPTTVFIESIVGTAVGARTGLSSFVAGLCFLASIFLYPIIALVPPEATGIVLFLVAVKLCHQLRFLDFTDYAHSAPAVLCLLLIPLTQNIAVGISIALIVGLPIWFVNGTMLHLLQPHDDEPVKLSAVAGGGGELSPARSVASLPLHGVGPPTRDLRRLWKGVLVCVFLYGVSWLNVLGQMRVLY